MADDRSNPKNWLGPYADTEQDWLALRAAEHPAYLASALAEYLELREWTPEQLAQRLRCAPQRLAKLGLCRRPELSVELHQQVSQIASHFELDYWSLRRLLEELALEPSQRQMHWQTEEFFDQRGQRPVVASRASREFTGMFGALDRSSGQDSLENVSQAPAPGQMDIPAMQQAEAPVGLTAPKALPLRKSWLRRLFATIGNFFSRK